MKTIKISKAKLHVVKEICYQLEDLAQGLDITLNGTVYADEIMELAKKIEETFTSR